MIVSRAASLGAVTIALAIGGCAVGPDFDRPPAPTDTGYTPEPLATQTASVRSRGGEAQHFLPDRDIPGDWWALFHSVSLNRLIDQALKANPDLDAAQAALRQAQENVYAEQGALFPQASLSFQAEKERFSGATFGNSSTHAVFGLVTPSLNISYAPDVFGGTRRQIESLTAQAEYQRFQLEAAYLTLTSNVVVAAVQEASLRGQVAATQDIIRDQAQSLRLVRDRFNLGGASQADVLTQEAQLAQTRATLPPLQKQLAQTRNQLTALAGQLPAHETAETFALDSMHLPQDLPVSLPSQLVEQRPDMRAAEAQMHAASAEIGVATANQLPQFSITGPWAPRRTASPTCSPPARVCGASRAASRRPCSTPVRCYTRSAPPLPPSSRRRLSIAARSSRPARTSPIRYGRCNRTLMRWSRRPPLNVRRWQALILLGVSTSSAPSTISRC